LEKEEEKLKRVENRLKAMRSGPKAAAIDEEQLLVPKKVLDTYEKLFS